jgi:hypothetical protein
LQIIELSVLSRCFVEVKRDGGRFMRDAPVSVVICSLLCNFKSHLTLFLGHDNAAVKIVWNFVIGTLKSRIKADEWKTNFHQAKIWLETKAKCDVSVGLFFAVFLCHGKFFAHPTREMPSET